MTDTKQFHIGDILSITTGKLLSLRGVGGLYDILNFMTGDSLFTHQLVLAAPIMKEELIKQLPELAKIIAPEEFANKDEVLGWVQDAAILHGEKHSVTARPDLWGKHDMLEDLRVMKPDAQILLVVVDDVEEESEVDDD